MHELIWGVYINVVQKGVEVCPNWSFWIIYYFKNIDLCLFLWNVKENKRNYLFLRMLNLFWCNINDKVLKLAPFVVTSACNFYSITLVNFGHTRIKWYLTYLLQPFDNKKGGGGRVIVQSYSYYFFSNYN